LGSRPRPFMVTWRHRCYASKWALTVQRYLRRCPDRPVDDTKLLIDVRLELLSRRSDDDMCVMLDTVLFMSFCGVFFSDRARLTRLPNLLPHYTQWCTRTYFILKLSFIDICSHRSLKDDSSFSCMLYTYYYYYYRNHYTAPGLCPGLSRWAGTRKVKPAK